MRRRSYASVVIALILLGLPIVTATAQGPRRPLTPMQTAARALMEGRYDEVDMATANLDAADPAVVTLKARAAIARGRYDQADGWLRPVALRAPASDAALELGLLMQYLGRNEASGILTRVAAQAGSSSDPVDIARGARALRALGRLQDANAAYRVAASRAPMDLTINTGWGELFLQTEQDSEALKSFQQVVEADDRWVPALIGAARALGDDNPPQAAKVAQHALEVNPSSVEAMVFLADQASDADHRPEARQLLAKALAVNPNSLEVHARLAALAAVEDKQDEHDAEVAKALAISPNYAEVYRVSGQFVAHAYRFDEAVALTRRALALDPDNAKALADLGVYLLRTGDETGARTALEQSFKLFPYSVSSLNLLKMMDTLDSFETFTDGEFIFRMHKDEAPVLREYITALAHKAVGEYTKRFEFTPKGPLLVEVFPKHDDFAVRTVGLPGMVGALGACFGRVVTMDSPKAATDRFQWEATLWHELAHVFTLQMSNQRLPRWLSEGISAFEEKRARPEWARPQEIEFATLLNRGETIKLRDLNAAFSNGQTISLAYFEAALLVEHINETYGQAGINKLVRVFAQGLDTEAALKTALNTNLDQLQASFNQFNDKMFGQLRQALRPGPKDAELRGMPLLAVRAYAQENPQSYIAQMALGRAAMATAPDEATQAFERAAMLVPVARGADSPHAQLAAIALQKKDRARAITELQALVAIDYDNIAAARQLAGLLREANITDPATIGPVYERIAAIDPFDIEVHGTLGRIALQRGQAETAAQEFRAVLALKPVDRAAAYTDLAEAYVKEGKAADAKKATLNALEIAPNYERAQSLLLTLARP